MAGKFEVYKDKAGEYRFRLKAGNGESVLTSEGYKTKDACLKGIASVQKNSADAERYEKKVAKNGKFHFSLKSGNHQVIGISEMYDSERSLENGIESVRKNGPTTTIADMTT